VTIDDKVFDQIVCYNMGLRVPYLVVTNGLVHYACKMDTEKPGYEYLNVIPLYNEINSEPVL
jgi:hypothetical protein